MDIEKLLQKEIKVSYNNSSIFCGFSTAVLTWAEQENLPQWQKLARKYAAASLTERPAILKQMQDLVKDLSPKTKENPVKKQAVVNRSAGSLEMPIQYMKNVGPKRAALFRRMGINNIEDLLFYFPRDYQDKRLVTPISEVVIGETAYIKGKIMEVKTLRPRARLVIFKVWIKDDSGMIPAVWFNQSFLIKDLIVGRKVWISGKVDRKYQQTEISVQEYEFIDDSSSWKPEIAPIYRATEKLTQKFLRKITAFALKQFGSLIKEVLPAHLVQKRGLIPRRQAVEYLHYPPSFEKKEQARCRLAYEELLLLQLAILDSGMAKKQQGITYPSDRQILPHFRRQIPFSLTEAQERVIQEVFADMEKSTVMARLIQGDVGSGKTMVAAAALLKSATAGYQGAMMVPTEILAQQHYEGLRPLFNKLGVTTDILTANIKGKARKELLQRLAAGEIDVLIGTHALIQEGVDFSRLGLVITDEQHRFGVRQRAALQYKGLLPDMLIMTATPIPRTLALTLYGDLDLSVIDRLPPKRRPVKTYAVKYEMEERIFAFLEKQMQSGRQIFVVCPLVEESEKIDLESATQLAEHLQQVVFPQRKISLIHGRMKAQDKLKTMTEFRDQKADILVSTTVIEVGINIPNASVIVVRDAERFGLSQLHQLRGRIGRGSEQSYCILMHNAQSKIARARMEIMVECTDGFKIAEADLELRGPGEFFGIKQHGLPELRVANLFTDAKLLEDARQDAIALLPVLSDSPETAYLAQKLAKKVQLPN